ncbi:MAG: hypothetical protein JEY96_12745 [Bacteroidales bacterium]|nr:hypothetical protein [Bacteroidales bacterium]
MGIYTIYDNTEIDNQIDFFLNVIIEKIFTVINPNEIKSIVLCGGFGRGEGSVFFNNEQVQPINDFDITIFPRKNLNIFKLRYSEQLESVAQELVNIIPIKQIDLGIGDQRKFIIRTLRPFFTINAFEFIHGHRVLFGKSNIHNLKYFYKSHKIPIAEGVKYLYTRGSGLLIPLLDTYQNSSLINNLNTYIEINKARLAIGDSYLIRYRKYHFSYQKRIEIAKKINFNQLENGNTFKQMYLNALEWKLTPTSISEINLEIELKSTIEHFLNYALWYESERIKKYFHSTNEYIRYKLDISNHSKSERKLYDLSKGLYLLSIFFNENNYSDSLNEKLFSIHKNDPIKHNLEYLTKKYLKEFHPGGIVKQLITS